jgi:DNA polymerase-4
VDLPTLEDCLAKLPDLHQQMEVRLARVLGEYRVSKKYLKLKFNDFVSTTIEAMSPATELEGYVQLCREAHARGNRPVRLIGLGVRLERGGGQGDGVQEQDADYVRQPQRRQLTLPLE